MRTGNCRLPEVLLCAIVSLQASIAAGITVDTAHKDASELKVREIVLRLIEQHAMSDWMFTDRIVIDNTAPIPRSHPVLTLNTRYLNDETEILTNIIHEQLHWFLGEHQEALRDAIVEMRALYPDMPDGPPRGAMNRRSTELHLVVCSLEYQALEEKIGREAAVERLLGKPYYTWVFATVVQDHVQLREILDRHGIVLP